MLSVCVATPLAEVMSDRELKIQLMCCNLLASLMHVRIIVVAFVRFEHYWASCCSRACSIKFWCSWQFCLGNCCRTVLHINYSHVTRLALVIGRSLRNSSRDLRCYPGCHRSQSVQVSVQCVWIISILFRFAIVYGLLLQNLAKA